MGVEDGGRVDLRSDTVTMPTEEMLAAISSVTRFGDDGGGDDETVKLLEAEAAAMFQKEAGLFTPTGIMANLISVLCHCEKRGSEAIVGRSAKMSNMVATTAVLYGAVYPAAAYVLFRLVRCETARPYPMNKKKESRANLLRSPIIANTAS